jgi:hypothetical protein
MRLNYLRPLGDFLTTPCRTATDSSASTLPPAGLPFLRSGLPALVDGFDGGLILSFLAIFISEWRFNYTPLPTFVRVPGLALGATNFLKTR